MSGQPIQITRHGRDTIPAPGFHSEERIRGARECALRAASRLSQVLDAMRDGCDFEHDWQQARILAAGLARALGLEVEAGGAM